MRVDPALGAVDRTVVLVDRNPIKEVLEYQPLAALPAQAFRFKLVQCFMLGGAYAVADLPAQQGANRSNTKW